MLLHELKCFSRLCVFVDNNIDLYLYIYICCARVCASAVVVVVVDVVSMITGEKKKEEEEERRRKAPRPKEILNQLRAKDTSPTK